jgi:hypothetical protein
MEATEQISSLVEQRPSILGAKQEDAESRPDDPAEKPVVPDHFRAPEPIQRKTQARLNYDPFEADVFLEILDTQQAKSCDAFLPRRPRKTKRRNAAARFSTSWPDPMRPFIVPDTARR